MKQIIAMGGSENANVDFVESAVGKAVDKPLETLISSI